MAIDEVDLTGLMPLETPVLKVSRPVAACSRCRAAKIKCDGKLPACTSCERNGRAADCTSTSDEFARGKERSYVSTLETRMEKLQAKLEEVKARKPSVISIGDDDTIVPSRKTSVSTAVPAPPNGSRAQRRKEASAIDDLVSDFGFLSVNATARDFHGFTGAMSYARLILWACEKDPLPQGTTKDLPARHAATPLIRHYLDNIFTLLPVFDEASFYTSVEIVYRDPRKAEPLDHWIVRMILAIASASLSEQRGDHHYLEGIGHVGAALELAEQVLFPGAISSVQALVLLTQYAMLDPHHYDSWNLIGAASRAMVDLGLHQDPPKGSAMSKHKLEMRRRVFYCVYALDRSASLVQTRAFSFSDDSAKVKVPYLKTPSSLPSSPAQSGPQAAWLTSHEQALDFLHLRQLQSEWYTDLFQSGRTPWDDPYQYIWNTCDQMHRWFENLTTSTSPSLRAFFELDLLYSFVYVLSPSPRVPVIHPFAQRLIFEYCVRYADLVLQLINDTTYTGPLTFYDAMRVFMTGCQFLEVLKYNTDGLLAGGNPAPPDVLSTTAAPPTMPVVPMPQGDTPQRFNTVRSITCIKKITEALSRFGLRWGYMSWNQRYQNETAEMLDALTERLRSLDEMTGRRRPSAWQHGNSTGSMHSSNGSSSYYSPPAAIALPNSQSHQSSLSQAMSSFADRTNLPTAHVSPPTTSYAPNFYQPQQDYNLPADTSFFNQSGAQAFNFNTGPLFQQHNQAGTQSTAPMQQFASWSGYGAASGGGPIEEEPAQPPKPNRWPSNER